MAGIVPASSDRSSFMSDPNKTSRVEFSRIEVGVLGNVRFKLRKIPELVEDIRQRGLLENLVVWHKRAKREPFKLPDGREVWDRYILIAGHRRHEAIRIIREEDPSAFDNVPVTLFEGNEIDARYAMLAENLGRDDLTPAPVRASNAGRCAPRTARASADGNGIFPPESSGSRGGYGREHACDGASRRVPLPEVRQRWFAR